MLIKIYKRITCMIKTKIRVARDGKLIIRNSIVALMKVN